MCSIPQRCHHLQETVLVEEAASAEHMERSCCVKQPAKQAETEHPCRVILVTQDFDHILVSNSRRNQVDVRNLAGSAP